MKTERRHDLETNTLALKMTTMIETIKPYWNKLLGVVILLVAMLAVSSFINSQSKATEENAWAAYAKARNSTDPDLENIRKLTESEEFAGTRMQEWAHLTWADRQVLMAARIYLRDRGAAEDRLRGARGIYETFANNAQDEQIRNRSRFGLGRIFEMLNKVEDAQREYSLVQGDLQPMASKRAEHLQSEGVKDVCEWLATAELPKPDITGGQGASGDRPEFNVSIPQANDGARPGAKDNPILDGFKIDGAEEAGEDANPVETQESAAE